MDKHIDILLQLLEFYLKDSKHIRNMRSLGYNITRWDENMFTNKQYLYLLMKTKWRDI